MTESGREKARHDVCSGPEVHGHLLARVRQGLISPEDAAGAAEFFRALSDPGRVRLLHALSEQELCVCDLAELTGLSVSAVSHQLRLLRASRLVKYRRSGRNAWYSLDDDHVRQLFGVALEHLRHP